MVALGEGHAPSSRATASRLLLSDGSSGNTEDTAAKMRHAAYIGRVRKALIRPQGELTTFLTRPISAACLIFAAVLLVFPLLPSLRRKREAVALDEGA